MIYAIDFSPDAERQIKALSKHDLPRIISIILSLREEPRHDGAVLCRQGGLYRGYALGDIYYVEIGAYRIDYEVNDAPHTITVASIIVSSTAASSRLKKTIDQMRNWLSTVGSN